MNSGRRGPQNRTPSQHQPELSPKESGQKFHQSHMISAATSADSGPLYVRMKVELPIGEVLCSHETGFGTSASRHQPENAGLESQPEPAPRGAQMLLISSLYPGTLAFSR